MTIELNSITSGYSTGLINDNFQSLEDYINDKLLNRDGVEVGEVNQMELNLDMNSNFVYNLPEPVLEHQAARLQDVQNAIAGADSANLISFTPYGSITSENVQGAIQELEDSAAQDPNTFEVDTDTGTQTLQDALNDRLAASDVFVEADLTVNIPTDYATLQEAIDALSTLSVKQGAIIDLLIETGHSPASGVLVENGDYGHFRISSVDAAVTLAAGFPSTDFIKGINAKMPTLNCLIDADGLGWSGYYAEQNSTGFVTSGNGVINAGRHGLLANFASNIYANDTVWTGASQSSLDWSGILAWASRITAQGADVSGSLRYGAQAAAGGVLSFRGGVASDCGRYGVRATNQGNIDAREVVAHDCGRFGVYAYICSTINAMGGDVRRGGEANIASIRSSTIDFSLEGAAIGTAVGGGSVASLYASFNSRIHASGCSIINAESHAILAEGGSTVTCAASTIENTTGSALRATGSSTIDAVNADIDGAAIGAYSSSSSVSVRSVSFTSITNDPVFITDGATVQAHGATAGGSAFAVGDTNADALNAFSSTGPSKGIVWA